MFLLCSCRQQPPAPPQPDRPSRAERLLGLVRKLIDYGREDVATLHQRAAADLLSVACNFGTRDLAQIPPPSRAAARARAEARLERSAPLDANLRAATAAARSRSTAACDGRRTVANHRRTDARSRGGSARRISARWYARDAMAGHRHRGRTRPGLDGKISPEEAAATAGGTRRRYGMKPPTDVEQHTGQRWPARSQPEGQWRTTLSTAGPRHAGARGGCSLLRCVDRLV